MKKGQMKISFGMIFSIILIIAFLGFAFYAIKIFLNITDSAKIGNFVENFREDIDKMWKSSQGSQLEKYSLPNNIEKICFIDFNSAKTGENSELYSELNSAYFGGKENLIFYPVGSSEGIDSVEIKHINLKKITENSNPFCIENNKGKISIRIKKNYGENSVILLKQ